MGFITWLGRVTLWLVFWPVGLWRSVRHGRRKSELRQQEALRVELERHRLIEHAARGADDEAAEIYDVPAADVTEDSEAAGWRETVNPTRDHDAATPR